MHPASDSLELRTEQKRIIETVRNVCRLISEFHPTSFCSGEGWGLGITVPQVAVLLGTSTCLYYSTSTVQAAFLTDLCFCRNFIPQQKVHIYIITMIQQKNAISARTQGQCKTMNPVGNKIMIRCL